MQESATLGLRESKKRATRRELTAAARRLAAEHGLDGVTVDKICAEVGVSVRTFFNYFGSREESILGEPQPLGDDTTRQVFRDGGPTGELLADVMWLLEPSETGVSAGREDLKLAFALFGREPRLLALQLARGWQHEQELALLIAERRGLAAADSSSSTVAAVAKSAHFRGLIDWVDATDEQPLRVYVQRATDVLAALGQPDVTT